LDPNKVVPLAKTTLLIRHWEKENLPNAHSSLSLVLFLVISYYTLIGKTLSLKNLFISIQFSEAGIRKQLVKLLADEWISIDGNMKDKRLKQVIAQPKMLLALEDYLHILELSYTNPTNLSHTLSLKHSNISSD